MLTLHPGRYTAAVVTGAIAAFVVYAARRHIKGHSDAHESWIYPTQQRYGRPENYVPRSPGSDPVIDPDDAVERASEDSFPASDPPASRMIS
jgi:hypothetical protein